MTRLRSLMALAFASVALTACSSVETPQSNNTAEVSPQIVYGTVSAVGSRPYMVAVQRANYLTSNWCGGSLIASNWVMTAAHCVKGFSASGIKIRAGLYNMSNSSEGQTVSVSNIYIHPSYYDATYGYDIALLKLSANVTHPYAAPGAIPSSTLDSTLVQANQMATVSGWGITEYGSSSSQLREVTIPITPSGTPCGGTPANTICGPYYQGKDSCNGDSGGPLARSYNGRFYILGIVSYGPEECRGEGVYTRVGKYVSWIKSVSGVSAQ
ncbi:S1 family peptidase [Deinococcus roseus]|uniref:Serine protease n=1 Tax=Deinococcus roseus TaxID=392414 RepID=A0ABQ2CVP3_9DEIO|nr:serine protease [Deinococcus roseus]GGJ18588.1 serine protease [Deinococcus roseus]